MKSHINYFKIDSKNNFSLMDNTYKSELTSSFNLEMAALNSHSYGSVINHFFYRILPINKKITDLFEKNLELLKLVEKDNNYFFSDDELEVSLDNILNSIYIGHQITFDKKTVNDISKVLFYSFKKIKNHLEEYKIKTQADFLSNLFEIQFREVDIIKSYVKEKDENIKIKKGKTFLSSSRNTLDPIFISNNYKYIKKNEEYNKLPNELIILINKFQYIKKFIFEIEKLDENKKYSYLIILLNVKWLFPNLIEIELNINSPSLTNIMDDYYKRKLIEKLKSMNKVLRTTRFDMFNIPYNYNNKWEAFTFVKDEGNDFEIVKYNNSIDKRPSFIESSTISNFDNSINFSNDNSNINNLNDQRNEIDYSRIVEINQMKFDMIMIYSYFIMNWNSIFVLNLKLNDSFNREILKSFYLKKLKPIEIDFLDVFCNMTKFFNLNFEFNALNYQVFGKILGIINFNMKLTILRMSFFTEEIFYSPSGLFKLSYDLDEKIDKYFDEKLDNMIFNDFTHHDIDHLIINQLLKYFERNLEILINLLLKNKTLRECTFVFHLPDLIINDERYINTLIKFIMNVFILVAFDKHSFNTFKIIAPLILFDDRKYPILNQILGLIKTKNSNSYLDSIKNLTIQLKFFEMTNIVNLITINLTSLFLGDLDVETFKAFVKLYCSNDFISKSKLNILVISLQYYIIDFSQFSDLFFNFYSKIPKELNELSLISNLKINNEQINSLIKIIIFNSVSKYVFEFNSQSEKVINDTKENICDKVFYSKNYSEKLKILIQELRKRNLEKEKRRKIYDLIQKFLLEKRKIYLTTKKKPIEQKEDLNLD